MGSLRLVNDLGLLEVKILCIAHGGEWGGEEGGVAMREGKVAVGVD